MTRSRRPAWEALIAPAIFAGLTLAMFSSVLLRTHPGLLSSPSTDMALQFLPWLSFGFGELRHGNLPLWNPYVFAGAPYFAGFQAALLYPPNWLHLFLPFVPAIDWIIAIHVFGAGYFTYFWSRGRGASIAAGILAGIMFMFSGAYFLHIYAGHLPHLCVMIWAPLLFLSLDKLNETGRWWWSLLGILAVAMQILSGHPQYVYYTGLISGLYVAIGAVRSKNRLPLIGGFLAIMVGASLLAAVQLLTGLQAAGESVRSSGTDLAFASMFALPPENLLTFFTPDFLGKLPRPGDPADAIQYFGRCYLWEMSVFISISGLVLSVFGAIASRRKNAILICLTIVTAALALGKHLFLYQLLYDYLPEYNHFRSVSKIGFAMTLFLCVMAADGFDRLADARRQLKITVAVTAVFAILLAIAALSISTPGSLESGGMWRGLLATINQSQESYFAPAALHDAEFLRLSAEAAVPGVWWAAGTMTLVCLLLLATLKKQWFANGLIVLATVELFIFAHQTLTTFNPEPHYPQVWLDAIKESPTSRVFNAPLPEGGETEFLDEGMLWKVQNLWGYDPGVFKRYAETIAASQHINPDLANQYLDIRGGSLGFFQMLRCRLALQLTNDTATAIRLPSPLPIAQLVPEWVLQKDRADAFAMMNSKDFDPRKSVILESPAPFESSADGVRGPAEIVDSSTDWIEIKTTTPTPNLLLVTNNFSTGWRVVPIEPTDQNDYQILPANHTLMAIPLRAGTHHFRLEYSPAAFRIGKWISILSLLAYSAAVVCFLIARQKLRVAVPSFAEVDGPRVPIT